MLLLLVVVGIIVFDQLTKTYIRYLMPVGDSVTIIPGFFHITHVRNPGAAFGIFPNQKIMFVTVFILVVTVLLYYYRVNSNKNTFMAISIGLIMGGAGGNLIDRITQGKVTDFFDFLVWPVFNIADSSVVVGVILLSLYMINDWRQVQSAAAVKD